MVRQAAPGVFPRYEVGPESIENSLRFNRPQSVAEEQYLFDLVQKQLDIVTESPAPDKE